MLPKDKKLVSDDTKNTSTHKKSKDKYKNLLADYKVKIDDIKNRIDIDLNRFNEASEADAKESLVITIFIPVKYIGKIELSVNAGTLNITDIENDDRKWDEYPWQDRPIPISPMEPILPTACRKLTR